MKEIRFNKLKNQRLKKVRGVSFEEILNARMICIQQHPARTAQFIMFYYLRGYVWMVPFIEEQDYIFLKTLYPSRKYTKMYRRGALP